MISWQSQELVRLVKEKYPEWSGFQHPDFVSNESSPLRKTSKQAKAALMGGEMRRLLANGQYDLILLRIEQLGKATPLLWTGHKAQGDLAPIYLPTLNKWGICEQLRALIHDPRPSPDRLDTFAQYCFENQIPIKWPLTTFLLFMLKPHAEVFVKPRISQWFLRFMGIGDIYTQHLSADMYERYKKSWHGLKVELADYKPQDMLDIWSLITVAYRVSQSRTGGLTYEAQVALDQPAPLREPEVVYTVDREEERHETRDESGEGNERERDRKSSSPGELRPLVLREAQTLSLTLEEIAEESGRPVEMLEGWIDLIHRKGQVVFHGPPGTGKTHLARRLATYLAESEHGLTEMVQFHPAYDYADFVEGLRPSVGEDGQLIWHNRPGIFLAFCKEAEEVAGPAILVVDELNRANLTRVFGELMVLLEYRDREIQLASGNRFQIPQNVRLICTMNTADRSLAQIDQAFRRRFAFIHLSPNFELLKRYHAGLNIGPLISLLEEINSAIREPTGAIGHTFFMVPDLSQSLESIWRTEIEPILTDRFYRDVEKQDQFCWETIYSRFENML